METDRQRWEREAADDGPDLRWGQHEIDRGRRQNEAIMNLVAAEVMGGTPEEIAADFVRLVHRGTESRRQAGAPAGREGGRDAG